MCCRFSGVWWILRNLVIHTSASTQARWRSDLSNSCVQQRLPARIRMYQIPPACLSVQRYLFCLLHSLFVIFLFHSFCISPCLTLPSRHAEVSKLMGCPRAPLLLTFLLALPSTQKDRTALSAWMTKGKDKQAQSRFSPRLVWAEMNRSKKRCW